MVDSQVSFCHERRALLVCRPRPAECRAQRPRVMLLQCACCAWEASVRPHRPRNGRSCWEQIPVPDKTPGARWYCTETEVPPLPLRDLLGAGARARTAGPGAQRRDIAKASQAFRLGSPLTKLGDFADIAARPEDSIRWQVEDATTGTGSCCDDRELTTVRHFSGIPQTFVQFSEATVCVTTGEESGFLRPRGDLR